MSIFKEMKNLLNKLNSKNKNLIPFFVFLGLIAAVFVGASIFGRSFNSGVIVLVTISIFILILFTSTMAILAVFRSLFVVGASLSLIIFLAQSYCALPISARTADDALRDLVGFGLLFVGICFAKSLYKEFFDRLTILKKINDGKNPWTIIIFFSLFIGILAWELYRVIKPIISGLCVHR